MTVAELTGLTASEVVARHASAELRVLFCGFAPGFAYLGDLPSELRVDRLATPRTRTPAGSVAIAGSMSGIYPADLPGGWRVIGRTEVTLFDPSRDRPPSSSPAIASVRAGMIEVVEPGALTSVQTAGRRPGWRHVGVPVGGAADAWSARLANRLVGNDDDAALLELTLAGPALRFRRGDIDRAHRRGVRCRPSTACRCLPSSAAACGAARCCASGRGTVPAATWPSPAASGVPVVLGSMSTDLRTGFGGHEGRALRAGDRLDPRESPRAASDAGRAAAPMARSGSCRVRTIGCLAPDALTGQTWVVGVEADRTGVRLDGPAARRRSARGRLDGPRDRGDPGPS